MVQSKEVLLLLGGSQDLPVTCVVTFDMEGVDSFADSLMYCIRMDTNTDIVALLTDEHIESIDYQLSNPNTSPIGDDDDTE